LIFIEKHGGEGTMLEPQFVEMATLPWGRNSRKKAKAA